jgi:RNA polymerase sigma factor (sigma-70 family)
MRSEESDERVFESSGANDSSGLSETRLQSDLSKPTESSGGIPKTVAIDAADHINLARKVAHGFSNLEDYEELLSICYLALVNAANKFDPSLGYEFSTYAHKSMTNSVFKHLKKRSSNIKTVQLSVDFIYRGTEEKFEIPSGLSFNEEHIIRLKMLGYSNSEIRKKLSLKHPAYKKLILSLRKKLEKET